MALAAMEGMRLREPGEHTTGLVRRFCPGGFQGSHPSQKRHERRGLIRKMVKGREAVGVCLLLLFRRSR